jgi:hypothetical protein
MNLLSDAAQKETWSHLKPMLTKGKVSQTSLSWCIRAKTPHCVS